MPPFRWYALASTARFGLAAPSPAFPAKLLNVLIRRAIDPESTCGCSAAARGSLYTEAPMAAPAATAAPNAIRPLVIDRAGPGPEDDECARPPPPPFPSPPVPLPEEPPMLPPLLPPPALGFLGGGGGWGSSPAVR